MDATTQINSRRKRRPLRAITTGLLLLMTLALVFTLSSCGGGEDPTPTPGATATPTLQPSPTPAPPKGSTTETPDVVFTLETAIVEGGLGFIGRGGAIEGVANPTLRVPEGALTQINLVIGDGALHDVSFPDFGATSPRISGKNSTATITFRADKTGEYSYFCTVPGHRTAGMEGLLVVGDTTATPTSAASIIREPTDLPPPIGDRPATTVRVELEAVELEGQLADGTTYPYWTFNERVPGPMLRVRQGDTVELTLKNRDGNLMVHSIDLHAVTGPGGGAAVMQVPPGSSKTFTFKALQAGLYVYHCATPSVASHIANGMYGLILVEPAGGLPRVDREFYIMQGEIYTQADFGAKGKQEFSHEKMLAETPEYFVFNGAAGALTSEDHALKAEVGETIRLLFGVGGPNFTSSFHVIGEMFDRVYNKASLTSPPLTNVQTTSVPPGGATMVELTLEVPGRYILVDHALSRLERGLVGFLFAEGADNPEVFHQGKAGVSP